MIVKIVEYRDYLHSEIDNIDDDLSLAAELIKNLPVYKTFFAILDRSRK